MSKEDFVRIVCKPFSLSRSRFGFITASLLTKLNRSFDPLEAKKSQIFNAFCRFLARRFLARSAISSILARRFLAREKQPYIISLTCINVYHYNDQKFFCQISNRALRYIFRLTILYITPVLVNFKPLAGMMAPGLFWGEEEGGKFGKIEFF